MSGVGKRIIRIEISYHGTTFTGNMTLLSALVTDKVSCGRSFAQCSLA